MSTSANPAAELSQLLLHLYAGISTSPPWQSFLGALRSQLQARAAILILRQPSEHDLGVVVSDGFDAASPQAANPYSSKLYAQDPFVNLPPGEVATLADYIADSTLRDSEFYKVCLQPYELFHFIGADIQLGEGLVAGLRLARPEQQAAFSRDDKASFAELLPHFRQALQLYQRLDHLCAERNAYSAAVEQLALASILLDEQGQIQQASPSARQLLMQGDGLSSIGGRLALAGDQDTRRLRDAINSTITSQRQERAGITQAMSITRPSGRAPLGLVVRPVHPAQWSHGQGTPCVALFISDPESLSQAPREQLAELFGLTPAEAGLSLFLANGMSLQEASEQLHISHNTGRAHLRSIFSKTGVGQQTKLVSLILQSVAKLG